MNEFSSNVEALQNALDTDDVRHTINAQEQLENAMRGMNDLTKEFSQEMTENSRNFAFWDNLIAMILILLQFIEAERKSTWQFHLDAVKKMIPYFFVTGHTNYARWTPVYIADMEELHVTAPEVFQQFVAGNHTVNRSSAKFSAVWSDMALEQSANCHSKSKVGGTIGITKKTVAHDIKNIWRLITKFSQPHHGAFF